MSNTDSDTERSDRESVTESTAEQQAQSGASAATESGGSRTDSRIMGQDPLLRVKGVTKRFSGLTPNDDITMAVAEGSITGLIGPNGAGKSTLFNCITGFYEPDAGSVYFAEQNVTGMDPHEIAQQGLVRSFQTPRKPEGMTVREAVMIGPDNQTGESILPLFLNAGTVRREERDLLERAEQTLERFEIGHLATAPATDLSGGQMKLVELARATMTDPDLLLLDEPVAGVNPTLAEKLKRFLRDLNNDGITFLIIEHDMNFIMELADTVVVLNQGAVLTEGPPETVQTDERVIDAYLGGPRT